MHKDLLTLRQARAGEESHGGLSKQARSQGIGSSEGARRRLGGVRIRASPQPAGGEVVGARPDERAGLPRLAFTEGDKPYLKAASGRRSFIAGVNLGCKIPARCPASWQREPPTIFAGSLRRPRSGFARSAAVPSCAPVSAPSWLPTTLNTGTRLSTSSKACGSRRRKSVCLQKTCGRPPFARTSFARSPTTSRL